MAAGHWAGAKGKAGKVYALQILNIMGDNLWPVPDCARVNRAHGAGLCACAGMWYRYVLGIAGAQHPYHPRQGGGSRNSSPCGKSKQKRYNTHALLDE